MRPFRYYFTLLTIVTALSVVFAEKATASVLNGLSLGLGTGVMSPNDADVYLEDKGNHIYPEVQVAYDYGSVKLGLHAGRIYRAHDTGRTVAGFTLIDEEMIFYPVEIDLCFMPLRFVGHGRLSFQPYLGIGIGTMLADGDNKEDVGIAPVIRAGIAYYAGDWHVIGIDLAYHAAEKRGDDYSYTTLMLEYRFRIPFVKKHQHEDASNL